MPVPPSRMHIRSTTRAAYQALPARAPALEPDSVHDDVDAFFTSLGRELSRLRAESGLGLGRLEDAAALLRVYRDLRGSLPLDERVVPVTAQLDRLLATQRDPAPPDPEPARDEPAAPASTSGPLAILYGPHAPGAAERAYAAVRPNLGDEPPVAVLPLTSVLPAPGNDLLVYGAATTSCTATDVQGDLEDHLTAAEESAVDLATDVSGVAVAAAEFHLACGAAPVAPEVVARLLAARAVARWVAGEPEAAGRLWREAFLVDPDRAVDGSLSPTVTALQLGAKSRAAEEPVRGRIDLALPTGWAAWVDGTAIDTDHADVPKGRRVVRLVGLDGEAAGAIVTVAGGHALVTTSLGLREAVESATTPEPVLRWLAGPVEEAAKREGAAAALVVGLAGDSPLVRRYEGGAGWS